MTDTIFALSSGAGRAGIAVVRLSGPQAKALLAAIATPCPSPRRASLRTIRDPLTSEPLDQALVLFFAGPNSQTGEDMAELHLHGSRAVVRAVLGVLAAWPGCRLAEPGEFARRAFENGRIDLTTAEGLADLIDAETEAQRRQALRHAAAEVRRKLEGWRDGIVMAMALTEAAIDFSDEGDVSQHALIEAGVLARRIAREIAEELARATRGEMLRDGFRVALLGPPNAGKSSLLNALARRDVAIVSPEAGTTRDVLEVRLDLKGLPVLVSDTAGLRADAGSIEALGIARALAAASAADLVLWLIDASDPTAPRCPPLEAGVGETFMPVWSKIDAALASVVTGRATLAVSAMHGSGIEGLLEELARRAEQAMGSGHAGIVAQARHRTHLAACLDHLSMFDAQASQQAELGAEHLRQAARELGRLTGAVDPEEVLGAIFGRFCIGK